MTRSEKIRLLVLRTLGNFFILFTIFGFFATFGPALYYEINFKVSQIYGVHYSVVSRSANLSGDLVNNLGQATSTNEVNNSSQGLFDTILSGQKDHILIPPDANFSVVIPKIGASERIVPNVDPSNVQEFDQVLRSSIAHAKGTAFPGMDGTIYLFAHSTDSFWDVGRYNAVFFLLTEMQPGDDVYIYFQGKRYNYVVYDTKIINADDTSYMNADLGKGERLIMQTCWPPGTVWKRLLVFAKPKSV